MEVIGLVGLGRVFVLGGIRHASVYFFVPPPHPGIWEDRVPSFLALLQIRVLNVAQLVCRARERHK